MWAESLSTDTETRKQDEERSNKQAIEVPLWVLILAALGFRGRSGMVGEQGGRERKEEKLLAILTLALLLSNVDWGRVLASNTLEALSNLT